MMASTIVAVILTVIVAGLVAYGFWPVVREYFSNRGKQL